MDRWELFRDDARLSLEYFMSDHLTITISRPYFGSFTEKEGTSIHAYKKNPAIRVKVIHVLKAGDPSCEHVVRTCLIETSGHLVLSRL
jgi:hypothetical protein